MLLKKIPALNSGNLNYFVRYSIVGGSATLVDISILYLLVDIINLHLLISIFISFILAATWNFFINKIWTFKCSKKNIQTQYLQFISIATIGLLLTFILMLIFVEIFNIWYILSKIITAIIVLIWNFSANKKWTFNPQK
jgi:putative flippase GtrA